MRALRLCLAETGAVAAWNLRGLPLSLALALSEFEGPLVWVIGDKWPVEAVAGDPWMGPFRHRRRLGKIATALTGLPTTLSYIGESGTWAFNSAWLRDACTREMPKPFARAEVIHHGVDPIDFPVAAANAEPRPWRWRLLYVGRLAPEKGLDSLVRAMVLLDSAASLEIIGAREAQHVERVSSLVAQLGLEDRVGIHTLPRSELAARYAAADVCVFPSEWEEPFGLVPLEAMACGTPVVATGTGGSAEFLIDGQNCVLFPAGDVEALADAVGSLAADPPLRQRVVAAGLRTAARLSVDELASRLEELLIG